MKTSEIIEVTQENIAGAGCFCLRSKPKSKGYQNKNSWLKERFTEGLKYLKCMEEGKPAGFIEYAPIEHSSRVVYGHNYLVIHCLWVQLTGKGYGTKLIQKCIQDAKEKQKTGVIVVTNDETSWTPGKEIFLKNGFTKVDEAPYGFELFVYKIKNAENPCFPTNWEERVSRFDDLTVLRTHQCPYVHIATENVVKAAEHLGLTANIIDIENREELLHLSPTPYGIYGVVYKKRLIAYHRITTHSVLKRLKEFV